MDREDEIFDLLDAEDLDNLDAIEAAYTASTGSTSRLSPAKPATPTLPTGSDSFDYQFDDFDLKKLEEFELTQTRLAASSNPRVSASSQLRQTTLDGTAFQPSASPARKKQPNNPFGNKIAKTKTWDKTAFAKSGWKKGISEKGKATHRDNEDEGEDEDESVEFEQFPAPEYSVDPPPSKIMLKPDRLAAKHWIYPNNLARRDYQFNIVNRCLFDNTLVALPTGLGKTFIAGVVMLNYYRWFPEGKIVFVAPTKPLVAQQVEACHELCGIPGRDAAELTGKVARATRSKLWHEKRVLFGTPQTFINDLATGICDPQSIVLLVIDEAHKGTGNYAYAQVVRFMMAKNPFFRLLALTATPGSTPEAVQRIIDSLHISHIEIRDEESLDIRQYLHKKHITQHIVPMNDSILKIQAALKKLMEEKHKPIKAILPLSNITLLHPYRCRMTIQGLKPSQRWALGGLNTLGSLARAMDYLVAQSVSMCYNSLNDLANGITQDPDSTKKQGPPKKSTGSKISTDPLFKDLMTIIETEIAQAGGILIHPKMEKLKSILIDHFTNAELDEDEGKRARGSSRAIIFVSFRACVGDVVQMLNTERPLIRAERFVGQSDDRKGAKGISQKDQVQAIQRFKAGEFNCLVSTSIGEEGLDIGEVDLIICYDAQKTPIRMLQRIGRTGRKRDGHVSVLLAEDREAANWTKAQDNYQEVQRSIVDGRGLELYSDVERLLPEDIKPQCLEMTMEIEKYARDEPKGTKDAEPKRIKRKRDDDPERNIPTTATLGFVTASKLQAKGPKKQKTMGKPFDPTDLLDDEDDMEIEAGLSMPAFTRPLSKPAVKVSQKAPLTSQFASTTKKKQKRIVKGSAIPDVTSASQFARVMVDEVDAEIEKGVRIVKLPRSKPRSPCSSSPNRPLATVQQSNPLPASTLMPRLVKQGNHTVKPSSTITPHTSWLLDDEDVVILDASSPLKRLSSGPSSIGDDDILIDSSFPVRAPGQVKRRPGVTIETDEESATVSSPSKPDCTTSYEPSPPALPYQRHHKQQKLSLLNDYNQYLEIEAELSGNDVAGGSSDTDGIESESDRKFVVDLPATQAPAGYDQSAVYCQSLFTQAPQGAPVFTSKPIRRGRFAGVGHANPQISSSPRCSDRGSDNYEIDGFIVRDDDEVVLLTSSQ